MRVLAYTLVSFAFNLFAYVCVIWWAPLFARIGTVSDRGVTRVGPVLPQWLKWIDTFDAHLDTGLQMGLYAKLPWVAASPYLRRVFWLYRNSCYGFDYWVLGVPFVPSEWEVVQYINEDDDYVYFLAVCVPYAMTRPVTGLDAALPYNIYAKDSFGLSKKGWKAWNMLDRAKLAAGDDHPWQEQPWGPEWRIPFTRSYNLFKGSKR